MTWQLVVFLCAMGLKMTFGFLVILGLGLRIRHRHLMTHGPRARALALAGGRFVRGEIDADTWRRIRDDLDA